MGISKFSDNDIKVTGTVRANFLDTANRENVLKAMAYLKDKPRHEWVLVRAYEDVKSPQRKKQRIQQNTMDKYLKNPISSSANTVVSKKCGFIVWKDKKVIPFYTNDLAFTPDADILYGDDPQAINAVHGLAPLKRWCGTESMQRTTILVPAPIVAYNMFMGSVDIMDQKNQCTSAKRREKHLSTDIFIFVISLVCLNAHAIYDQLLLEKLIDGEKISHAEFKRQIAELLCKEKLCKEKKATETTNTPPIIPQPAVIVEADVPLTNHQISQIASKNFRPSCYVCKMYNTLHCETKPKPRINFVCTICNLAFHPTCFTAYHNPKTVDDDDVCKFLKDINPPMQKMQLKVKNMEMCPFYFKK